MKDSQYNTLHAILSSESLKNNYGDSKNSFLESVKNLRVDTRSLLHHCIVSYANLHISKYGFKNKENDCYKIAGLHLLFMLDVIMKPLCEIHNQYIKDGTDNFDNTLQVSHDNLIM